MATFRFELNSKPTRNKTYSILLCVTANGKRKRVKTSIEVKRKSDFNYKAKQDNWIRPSEPNSKKWNDTLSKELEKAKNTYRDLKEDGVATSDNVITELTSKERTHSFIEYARQRTQEIYNAGGIRNWKKYNGFCNKLEAFQTDKKGKIKDLTFLEITPSYLSKFEAYLYSLNNERHPDKKLHPNTIQVNFNIFRTIVKRAIEIDGYMKAEKNPFITYKFKGVKTTKEKLNAQEIQMIEDCELEPNSLTWHCRNYFLFSFYCAGIRVGDLIQLRWGNITSDGRLRYQMGKNHKDRDIVLVQRAKEILSCYHRKEAKAVEYIFPLLDNSESYSKATTQEEKDTLPTDLKVKLFNQISAKNALINKELKKIAKIAEIEKNISFHVSRHSFAKVAKEKGADNAKLRDLLAHSSLKITEGYMGSFDTAETDKTLEDIFNKPEENRINEELLLKQLRGLTGEELSLLLQKLKK